MGKRRRHPDEAQTAEPAANAFAGLAALRGQLPPGDEPVYSPVTEAAYAAKVVINRERAGRGGKTVTVIRGVLLQGELMDRQLRDMRKALGTGGHLEGESIVLNGDVVKRAAAWLEQAGAQRVVIGN